MRVCSSVSPIVGEHLADLLAQTRSFRLRQVGLFVLGKGGEQKNRYVATAEEIDNPRPATLAATAKAEPQFADATGAWNHHAAAWIDCNPVHNGRPLLGREQPFRIGKIIRRFDYGLHRQSIYTAMP